MNERSTFATRIPDVASYVTLHGKTLNKVNTCTRHVSTLKTKRSVTQHVSCVLVAYLIKLEAFVFSHTLKIKEHAMSFASAYTLNV